MSVICILLSLENFWRKLVAPKVMTKSFFLLSTWFEDSKNVQLSDSSSFGHTQLTLCLVHCAYSRQVLFDSLMVEDQSPKWNTIFKENVFFRIPCQANILEFLHDFMLDFNVLFYRFCCGNNNIMYNMGFQNVNEYRQRALVSSPDATLTPIVRQR